MDEVEEAFERLILRASQDDLLIGDRRMRVHEFKAHVIDFKKFAIKDDVILGLVFLGGTKINNAYILYRRDNILLKAPLKDRPYRISYNDKYWDTQKEWLSRSEHQTQFWNYVNILNNINVILKVGSRPS